MIRNTKKGADTVLPFSGTDIGYTLETQAINTYYTYNTICNQQTKKYAYDNRYNSVITIDEVSLKQHLNGSTWINTITCTKAATLYYSIVDVATQTQTGYANEVSLTANVPITITGAHLIGQLIVK